MQPSSRAMAGDNSMAANGSRPARPGAASAQPFVRVAGEADVKVGLADSPEVDTLDDP